MRHRLSAALVAAVLAIWLVSTAAAFRGDYPPGSPTTPPSNEGPTRGGRNCPGIAFSC